MTNYIWITTQKEMLHMYPEAPEGVEFLKNLHRHMFHFKIYLEIKHTARDVEFIQFKLYINQLIDKMDKNLKNKSCEMISNYLADKIKEDYSKRDIKIEVSEDGENGSEYYYVKSNS